MNVRLLLSTLMAFVAALVGGQTVSIHSADGDGLSWALVRVAQGGVANLEVGGVHIGPVTHDDLFVVQHGKTYHVTDESLIRRVEAANDPVAALRKTRLAENSLWHGIKMQSRSEEHRVHILERSKQGLEHIQDRLGASATSDLQRQIMDIDRQMADFEREVRAMNAKVDEEQRKLDTIAKSLDDARAERNKKVELILTEAIANGDAKPWP